MSTNTEMMIHGVMTPVTDMKATAEQIDKAGLMSDHSHENLIRNWYFADPVDQRGGYVVPPNTPYTVRNTDGSGTTGNEYVKISFFDGEVPVFTYNGVECYCANSSVVRGYTGAGYTIDGWKWDRSDGLASVIIHDGYITFQRSGWLREYAEADRTAFDGKTMTASILTKEGELQTTTFIATAEDSYENSEWWMFNHYFNGDAWVFGFCAFNKDCNALVAKLELGSVQTLAHQDENGNWVLNDPPPDKHMELFKCCMSTADPADEYANNKKTPLAVNALPRDGSAPMKKYPGDNNNGGRLYLEKATMSDLAADVAIDTYGNKIRFFETGGSYRGAYIDLTKCSANVDNVEILHTGNKPSGLYTGNGSAATRTIDTGGIGVACLVYTLNFCAIVTPVGAICFTNGVVEALDNTQFKFNDGVLTISSVHNNANANGWTYTYQVL